MRKLTGMQVGLAIRKKPLNDTKKYLQKRFKGTFRKGGEPKRWKPITDVTLQLREVNKNDSPLIDRGNLMRALTSDRSRYSKHKVFTNKLRFGISSTLRYAQAMDQGAKIDNGWGRGIRIVVPKRPFMTLIKDDIDEIEKIFDNYLEMLVNL